MSGALFWLAALTLVGWAANAVDAFRGRRRVAYLTRIELPSRQELDRMPAVSIVVPARNEAGGLEAAMRSLLALRYSRLEIVAVDDRSDDGTGAILDRLAAGDPRLRVLHVTELPAGWMGKNYALHLGAEKAGGDWILFTDADVVHDPTLLGRAVDHAERSRLDHLTAAGDVHTSSLALELFVATFAMLLTGFFRPWRVGDPGSSAFIGIGAFNLVRADAYRRIGGHASIRLRPDDDLRLGEALKRAGARSQFAVAERLLRVEWYPSLSAAVRGLEKNSLAAVDYSLPKLASIVVGSLALMVWPWAAVLVTDGPTRWLNLAAVLLMVVPSIEALHFSSLRWWTALAFPVGVLMVLFTSVRAAALTYWRGGIFWRGTFYPLPALRSSRPDRQR